MYALFLILNDVYKLDEIQELCYDLGLGATTLDSQGMGKILLSHNIDVPMFGSIRKLIDSRKPYNKTVFSIIHSEEKKDEAVEKMKDLLDGFDEPGIGFMFVMPVIECYSSKHIGERKREENK